jgi:hypothetical protein
MLKLPEERLLLRTQHEEAREGVQVAGCRLRLLRAM